MRLDPPGAAAQLGIGDELVRLSVGIEALEDLRRGPRARAGLAQASKSNAVAACQRARPRRNRHRSQRRSKPTPLVACSRPMNTGG